MPGEKYIALFDNLHVIFAENTGHIKLEYAESNSGPTLKKLAASEFDSNTFGADTPEK